MKIVRFSQNGHSPRLGCFMGQDRVVDLEASCAAWLSAKARVLMGLADMCVLDSWALGVPLSQCPALAYPASAIPGPGRAAQA